MNHINYLELLAAFQALQCFTKQKHNITIQLMMDNLAVVTYINKLRGPHSLVLGNLAISLWEWSLQKNIYLIAEYLPRHENWESRAMKDRCN